MSLLTRMALTCCISCLGSFLLTPHVFGGRLPHARKECFTCWYCRFRPLMCSCDLIIQQNSQKFFINVFLVKLKNLEVGVLLALNIFALAAVPCHGSAILVLR